MSCNTSSAWETIATWFVAISTVVARVGVGGDDGRACLTGQHLAQPSDIIGQCVQRKLGCGDGVAIGLQALDDGAPTGAVGPGAVDKHNVRESGHLVGPFLATHKRRATTS